MLKNGEDGRRNTTKAKKMRNYFFKNIIFFFSFCILTENGKSAADKKVVCGSNVPK